MSDLVLRDDQLKDARWLLDVRRGGLFNDPGTGKSFPAITAALELRDYAVTLIVAPQYLLWNWRDMLVDFGVPESEIGICIGERAERNAILQREYDFTLVNYEMFSYADRFPTLLKRQWDLVICDESHRLRGRNSAMTKAAYRLKCDRFWALTGTPLVTNAADVFPILKIIDKDRFRSYWRFVDEWCKTETNPWATIVRGPKTPEDYFRMLQGYFIMRPFDSIPELKGVTAVEHAPFYVTLPKSVMAAHKRAKKEYVLEHPTMEKIEVTSAGAMLSYLRRMCSWPPTQEQPKWKVLKDLLLENGDEQIIVFCWFHDTVDGLVERIRQEVRGTRPVEVVTGSFSAVQKDEAIRRHRLSSNGILIANIAACNEGVNLQTGHIVVFYEQDYLRTANEQAIARCKRMGQEQVVQVYNIVARKTVEEAVYRTQLGHKRVIHQPIRQLMHELYAIPD